MRVVNQNFVARKKPGQEPTVSDIVRKSSRDEDAGLSEEEAAQSICQRYIRNRTMIDALAKANRIKAVFVWQPVPTYKFDLKLHPFADEGFGRHRLSGIGYQQMALLRQTNAPLPNDLSLADVQENAREPLYVDAVHYGPKMCERIADEIVRFMQQHSVLSQH